MADTAQASLTHWSEEKRSGMEDFYHLATDDYRHLALSRDWRSWLEAGQIAAGDRALTLLDVACGSGKFPTALVTHADVPAAAVRPIEVALLDPSAFSIAEARKALKSPFVAAQEYETPLETFDAEAGPFDIVWATHALYAIPRADLDRALTRFVEAIGQEGFIAHAAQDSHYIRFDRLFRDAFGKVEREAYVSAEDLMGALDRIGAVWSTQDLHYTSNAALSDTAKVEGYLQRCVFDDSHTLDDMLQHASLGAYLGSCKGHDGWRFPQHVKLFTIRP